MVHMGMRVKFQRNDLVFKHTHILENNKCKFCKRQYFDILNDDVILN